MEIQELDKWWVHLQVPTKEKAVGMPYPSCTAYWGRLTEEEKMEIYIAMGGRSAHDHHKWKKGNTSFT